MKEILLLLGESNKDFDWNKDESFTGEVFAVSQGMAWRQIVHAGVSSEGQPFRPPSMLSTTCLNTVSTSVSTLAYYNIAQYGSVQS